MTPMGDFRRHESIFGFSGPAARAVAAGIMMAAITVVLLSLPTRSGEWLPPHELVRKLYLLPILLCAMWFGSRGTLVCISGATVACLAPWGSPWPAEISAQFARVGEVAVFWLVGALAASLFDQQGKFVREIEAANDNTLLALAAALDVREHNTGLHSQRVADYTIRLAREMGVRDPADLDRLWRGALLHDVGKIGIPDEVLLKPGPLTEEEWKVMRTHPEVGSRMLRRIDFLKGPAEIVLSHHERFDGAGYPRRIRGELIPLGARLFAVIDVYDALTTDRAYHTARSHGEALENLREGVGTRFDPAVVAAFGRIPFEELLEIARNNQTPLARSPSELASAREAAPFLAPSPQP